MVGIDDLKNGVGVLFGELPRLGALFLVAGLILGVIVGASVVPTYLGFIHNPYISQCTTASYLKQSFFLIPVFVYLHNPFLADAEGACPALTGNFTLLLIWYLEAAGVVLLGAYIGIVVWGLNG